MVHENHDVGVKGSAEPIRRAILGLVWAAGLVVHTTAQAADIGLTLGLSTLSGTPEAEVANAIATFCPGLASSSNLSGDAQQLLAVCTAVLSGTNFAQVEGAYTDLSPRSNTANSASTAQNATSAVASVAAARMAGLRNGTAASLVSRNNWTTFDGVKIPSDWIVAENGGGDRATDATISSSPLSRVSFYINGEGSKFEQEQIATVSGFDGTRYGATGGVDFPIGRNTFLGVATSLDSAAIDIAKSGGTLDTENGNVTFYGTWYNTAGFHTELTAGFSASSYETTRHIDFVVDSTTVNVTANGLTYGRQSLYTFGAGYDMAFGSGFNVSLNAGFQYSKSTVEAYDETGAGGLNLSFQAQTVKTTSYGLELILQKAASTRWAVLLPQVGFNYVRAVKQAETRVQAYFFSDPSRTPIDFTSKTEEPDVGRLTLGVSAVFARGSMAFLQFEKLLLTDYYSQQSLALGWRKEF